ncbi:MAG: efflux RND transporter permease subunit, partial [Deltaproteobacteria bacterium]|nr:efflux RND transporter permease subunit [Deltaproteobacteria bacterium]
CAVLLRKPRLAHHGPLVWFNQALEKSRNFYVTGTAFLIRHLVIGLLLFITVIGSTWYLFSTRPTSFLPQEDQGYLFLDVQLPEAASLGRTGQVMERVTGEIRKIGGVQDVIGVSGYSILSGDADNVGLGVVILSPWDQRQLPNLQLEAITGQIQRKLASISTANSFAFAPPPIRGLGSTSGFDFRLLALEGQSPHELSGVTMALMIAANQDPAMNRVFSTYTANTPQVFININRTRAEYLRVPVSRIFSTLQAQLGSVYVNDFNLHGHTYQVKVQADASYRDALSDIKRLYVRSDDGNMVPMTSLATLSMILGPQSVKRYNQYASARFNGKAAPGFASGQAMAAMERLAAKV